MEFKLAKWNLLLQFTDFTIFDENAPKTITYKGTDEALKAYNFFRETERLIYDNTIENLSESEEINKEILEWKDKTRFLFLVNRYNKEISGVWDMGRYCPTSSDYLLKTDYICFNVNDEFSIEDIELAANNALKLFNQEIQSMIEKAGQKKPLFLIEHLGYNTYSAWSLKEQKMVYVTNFKTYRKKFNIIGVDGGNITNTEDYIITTPSPEIIYELELNLFPSVWNEKMAWDIWEEREPMTVASLNNKDYQELYEVGVELANKGRRKNYNLDKEFAELESRLNRLVRLDELGAPTEIIKKEVSLIETSINTTKTQIRNSVILKMILGK